MPGVLQSPMALNDGTPGFASISDIHGALEKGRLSASEKTRCLEISCQLAADRNIPLIAVGDTEEELRTKKKNEIAAWKTFSRMAESVRAGVALAMGNHDTNLYHEHDDPFGRIGLVEKLGDVLVTHGHIWDGTKEMTIVEEAPPDEVVDALRGSQKLARELRMLRKLYNAGSRIDYWLNVMHLRYGDAWLEYFRTTKLWQYACSMVAGEVVKKKLKKKLREKSRPLADHYVMGRAHALAKKTGATAIINGHTHRRMLACIGQVLFVNTGSFVDDQLPGIAVVQRDGVELFEINPQTIGQTLIRIDAQELPSNIFNDDEPEESAA